jgi:transposase
LSGGLWALHDRLQPVQPLEPARALAGDVPSAHGPQRHLRYGRDRQHPYQGTPLGGGRKRGAFEQAIGASRGGRTSKLHALTDEKGRPRVLLLTAGNINDITIAASLLDRAGPVRRLIADRGYDANHLRHRLAAQHAEAVIPSTTSRAKPIPYNRRAYKARNRIERMWCRIKDWRRIATRYDKLARNFLSGVYLAALFACWLN